MLNQLAPEKNVNYGFSTQGIEFVFLQTKAAEKTPKNETQRGEK